MQETSDSYENVQSRMENEAFPTKLAEGTSELTPSHPVEDATEATEGLHTQLLSLTMGVLTGGGGDTPWGFTVSAAT